MIPKDFANSFAEKMKESAEKENKFKEQTLECLNDLYDILERIYVRIESIEYIIENHYNKDSK